MSGYKPVTAEERQRFMQARAMLTDLHPDPKQPGQTIRNKAAAHRRNIAASVEVLRRYATQFHDIEADDMLVALRHRLITHLTQEATA